MPRRVSLYAKLTLVTFKLELFHSQLANVCRHKSNERCEPIYLPNNLSPGKIVEKIPEFAGKNGICGEFAVNMR